MTGLHLAIDRGPTDAAWNRMVSQPEKYAPFIRRLTGYFLMCGAVEDDRDFPSVGTTIELAMPGYDTLTSDEAYFVHVGAMSVVCAHNAAQAVDDLAKAWLADGAPE